ncbi:MAG: 50S ribosomal protein L5 [Phycisphaerae bacterium]|nr:50S ribosomal protein L5 [Phycisphaerae bacterium]
MARLAERYRNEVLPGLRSELGRQNPMSIPRIEKVIVSMGIGRATQERKRLENARKELATITGQLPLVCKARKSVSNFKVRQGQETGLKVTLRGKRMYEFIDRLVTMAIPRVRDFRGLDPKGFDGRGNYNFGLSEQTVFPEIEADKVEFPQGMNITMVTTARNDREALLLLKKMGLPFRS